MCSMGVIQNEVELMTEKIKTSKSGSERSFYKSKIDMLNSQKEMIEQKVEMGLMTLD